MHKKRVSSKIFLEKKKIILPSQQGPNGRKVKTNKQTCLWDQRVQKPNMRCVLYIGLRLSEIPCL